MNGPLELQVISRFVGEGDEDMVEAARPDGVQPRDLLGAEVLVAGEVRRIEFVAWSGDPMVVALERRPRPALPRRSLNRRPVRKVAR